MSFSGSQPAPAPAGGSSGGGGFNFGGSSTSAAPFGSTTTTTTPAPATGFTFGATTASSAPATAPAPSGGFNFGGLTTPAPAAGGGFSFTSTTPAPAPFGATPAPAPFGATPAPAPFGATPAPAPFGATPAPAPFGSLAPAQQQQAVAGRTQYANLPQNYRTAIDNIHEMIMKHRRTMNLVHSMAPKRLIPTSSADIAAGTPLPLAQQIRRLEQSISNLQQELNALHANADTQKGHCETTVQQAIVYGQWPLEATAVRRGVRLSTTMEEKKQPNDIQQQLRQALDRQMVYVDRLEHMPSPYLWQVLNDMQRRLEDLHQQVDVCKSRLQQLQQTEIPVAHVVETQHQMLYKICQTMERIHIDVERLRHDYRMYEKQDNVLEKAAQQEIERERKLDERVQMQFLKAAATAGQPSVAPATPGAPAPGAFSFGGTPAPGGFGGTSSAPSSAPSGGFSFGGGSSSSSTPAPAPFGAPAPASAAAPLFGSSRAPAPGFGFASSSSSSSSTKKKSGSRSSNRLFRS